MRKKAAGIMAMVILLTAAGCAPGDISQYTARAQQAGEAVFEGKAQQAAVMGEGTQKGPEEAEAAEEESESAGHEAVDESSAPAGGGETDTGDDNGHADEDGSKLSAEAAAAEEDRAEAAEAESAPEEDIQTQDGQAQLSGAAVKEDAQVQAAMEKKAALFDGHLAGRDAFKAAEEEAWQAVLRQADYEDTRLCLSNRIQTGKDETGTFLLLFERVPLVSRSRVTGDLWFYAEEKATRLLKDVQVKKLLLFQAGGHTLLLVQTDRDGKTGAQVYRVSGGRASGCFADAADIDAAADGLCVTYRTDYVRYAVADGWTERKGEQICFYQWEETGFVQQRAAELTAEEYLALIQPGENEEEQAWKRQQEEQFFFGAEGGEECRYSFFSLGENRAGYRECRTGVPAEERGKSDTAAAEYAYRIYELENGKLTMESRLYAGEGYYFTDWKEREEELRALSDVPVLYGNNQIGKASGALRAKERSALERVLKVGGYGAEELCFVRSADYDGDKKTESFVAAGRYDGVFGAPVCDLWLAAEEETVLLEEGLPVKDVLSFQCADASFFLLEGYETDGAQDRLYGRKGGEVCRLLAEAVRIEAADNGDVTAWFGAEEGEMPRYYRWAGGEISEYEAEETDLRELLAYENGRALLRHLTRDAEAAGGELSCVRQNNGLFHVMCTDRSGKSRYETYRIRGQELVLVDCGEGGFTGIGPGAAEEADPE